jgi:hypothetical protein
LFFLSEKPERQHTSLNLTQNRYSAKKNARKISEENIMRLPGRQLLHAEKKMNLSIAAAA